ncbi:MAG TPA: hypothetical protein VGH37_03260 [Candidatus Acidoferrum sp.]|jgi:hypothetical protein
MNVKLVVCLASAWNFLALLPADSPFRMDGAALFRRIPIVMDSAFPTRRGMAVLRGGMN